MSKSTQVKVSLPSNLYSYLKNKSVNYGLSMSEYMRHLILRDADNNLSYQASSQVQKSYQQAKQAQNKNTLIKIENTDQFFANL